MDIFAIANQMKMERKSIFDLDIRVTFYARVSTTRDEQENSIENQIAFFTKMIHDNPHWEYIEGYADRIRGESAENRVAFKRMIADGKNGKFDLVLTKEISRFARNTIDSLTYTRELLKAGVGVFFQNDGICTIDTDSELRLTIMSSIATDEVRKLSERVHWGHKRAIESGHVLGNNRIFGYDKKDCKLTINENEAEMVRTIFDLYSTGRYSVKAIEQILFDKGYRGRNNNRIHHNTISGIIQNPKYKGYFCGNKVRVTDYRTKEQRFLPQEEWIMYEDKENIPPIVSEEIWDKCNVMFKEKSDMVKSRGHSFKTPSVLSGKIICGVHNTSYWRTSYSNSLKKGTPIYQWLCGTKRKFGADSCGSFAIMENDIYQILGDCFRQISEIFKNNIDEFIKPFVNTSSQVNTDKQIHKLEAELAKENKKKEKLLDLYTEDAISKKEFRDRNEALNVRIGNIQNEISALKKQTDEDTVKDRISSISSIVNKLCKSGAEFSKSEIDQFVIELIDKIIVTPIGHKNMHVDIYLRSGDMAGTEYCESRQMGNIDFCRLGNISKKMIESYEQNTK